MAGKGKGSMSGGEVFGCFSVASVAGVYDDIYVPHIFIPWGRLLVEPG